MALLFQKPDEVDQEVKDERHTGLIIVLSALWLLWTGLMYWLGWESLTSSRQSAVIGIGVAFAIWTLNPFYQEFRIRTKEIDGKVSALGESVDASRKEILRVLERLDTVQQTRDIYELKMELEIVRRQLDVLVGRK